MLRGPVPQSILPEAITAAGIQLRHERVILQLIPNQELRINQVIIQVHQGAAVHINQIRQGHQGRLIPSPAAPLQLFVHHHRPGPAAVTVQVGHPAATVHRAHHPEAQ